MGPTAAGEKNVSRLDRPTSRAGSDPVPVEAGAAFSWPRALGGFVAAVLLTVVVLYVAGHSGGTLEDPVGGRVWEIALTVIAAGLLIAGIARSVRSHTLSRLFLIVVSTGSAFWQETYGDWGTYLLYSPRFATYSWGDTMWSSPVRALWFLPGYIFFYATFFVALEAAFVRLRRQWPDRNPYLVTAAAAFPLFYVFDLLLEGAAHGFGWWQYQYAFGPTMAVGTGHFPLLWPILEQVPFMITAVWTLTWRNAHGEDLFEVAARLVTRKPPGQAAILASWVILVNALFLIETILPLMAMRWIFGPASAVVP